MNLLVYILPVSLLVTYSQVVVKWRATQFSALVPSDAGLTGKLLHIISDPFILSAYVAAFLGSIGWLFVVSRLPLAIAFPVYIGITFASVIGCSALLLNEPLNGPKLIAVCLILAGVAIGSKA